MYDISKAFGIYKAIVEDNKDPLNRGRCRVRILGHSFPNQDVTNLPWAETLSPIGGDDTINFLYIPPVGSLVYVAFLNGHISDPVIVGYGRRFNAPILKDYRKYYDSNEKGFLFLKFGEGNSPSYVMDSKSKKLLEICGKNYSVIGESREMASDNKASLLHMSGLNINLLFRSLHKINQLLMSTSGIDVNTTNNFNQIVGSKRSIKIGKSYGFSFYKSFGISALFSSSFVGSEAEKILEDINRKGSYAEVILGNVGSQLLTNVSDKMSQLNHENIKSFFLRTNKKKLFETIKKLDGPRKKLFINFLKIKDNPKKAFKDLNNGLKVLRKQKLREKLNSLRQIAGGYIDELEVQGGQRIKILGNYDFSSSKGKLQFLSGLNILSPAGTINTSIQKGNFGISITKGRFKVTIAAGKAFFEFGIPKNKLIIRSILSKIPLFREDTLVKKRGFDDLKSLVMAIVNYINTHTHTAGPFPTTPPLIPLTISPIFLPKYIKFNIFYTLKPMVYFTNNLEAS